jgi:hypothetical protein
MAARQQLTPEKQAATGDAHDAAIMRSYTSVARKLYPLSFSRRVRGRAGIFMG